jgi:hypothetical protein
MPITATSRMPAPAGPEVEPDPAERRPPGLPEEVQRQRDGGQREELGEELVQDVPELLRVRTGIQ